MAENGTLTLKQARFLEALPTVRSAAQAAGISERTAWRYLADPRFKAELRRRQDLVLASVTAALVGLNGKAVEALQAAITDAEAGHNVCIRAATAWLEQARKTKDLGDLVAHFEELERRLKDEPARQPPPTADELMEMYRRILATARRQVDPSWSGTITDAELDAFIEALIKDEHGPTV